MIDLNKPRLTKKYNGGFGLVKVKDDEQDVESPYPNTLKAILECFSRLGELENAIESGELAPVVHGYWQKDGCGEVVCSACDDFPITDIDANPLEGFYPDYCPNCGAKMDLEGENER